MKAVGDLIPWKTINISVYPYGPDYWSMNPSIWLDKDGTYLCVSRIVDYCMPDGVTRRSRKASPTAQLTRNAMLVLDPKTWKPIKIYKMHERDDYPRVSTPHAGFEDMRLFSTDKGGLQGIAASLHLRRDAQAQEGAKSHQPPEQVLLSFDDEFNIVRAQPIRQAGNQKNWAPFNHCVEARFLYSISKGILFDDRGAVHGDRARVVPSVNARPVGPIVLPTVVELPVDVVPPTDLTREPKPSKRKAPIRGGDVQLMRGARRKIDAMSSRHVSRSSVHVAHRSHKKIDTSTQMMGTRALMPTYNGLRGGTQLIRIADDAWLGIGHEMKWVNHKKFYFHSWYVVNSHGKMTAVSPPMKLAENTIEFAAGMAIDGDRVVVSFGIDDMESRLGETQLSAVMNLLRPVIR